MDCAFLQESGLQLIRQGEFSKLASLLSPPEFAPLRPLLVLLGWEQCTDCDGVSTLLTKLWADHVSVCNVVHRKLWHVCLSANLGKNALLCLTVTDSFQSGAYIFFGPTAGTVFEDRLR